MEDKESFTPKSDIGEVFIVMEDKRLFEKKRSGVPLLARKSGAGQGRNIKSVMGREKRKNGRSRFMISGYFYRLLLFFKYPTIDFWETSPN